MQRDIAERWLKQAVGEQANFRDGQWEAVSALVEKHERVLVVQRTGWGKSLVYFLATRLMRDAGAGMTLLISPLLALMRNQIEAAERLGLRASAITSENSEQHQVIEAQVLQGDIDLLLISPERLGNAEFQRRVWTDLRHNIGLLVVDEVHCISDWGHDFRPNYRRIVHVLDDLPPNTPVLGTTATANDRVVRDVTAILGDNLLILRGGLTRQSLSLYTFPEPMSAAHRLALLVHLLNRLAGSGIIYCSTTRDCQRVSKWLNHKDFNTSPYYSGVEEDTGANRPALEAQLLNNEVKALVASVALGMGFDKPDLGFVIHYQQPGSLVAYYQQIGRAGRAIDDAKIILMHGPEDEDIQHYFINTAFPHPEQVQQALDSFRTHQTLRKSDLGRFVNGNNSTIEKVLLQMEIEGIISREDNQYLLVDPDHLPDYERWSQVTAQRYAELAQMKDFLHYDGCLMQYIARALDDPTATQPCGQCKNCRKKAISYQPTTAEIEEAARFLREGEPIMIEPRKQYPTGLPDNLKGRLKTVNHSGVALCYYHDQGYGTLIKQGKYSDDRYSDALVEASATLLTKWFEEMDSPPQWITAVPSLRRPTLVPDFAARLANRVSLPFYNVIQKVADRPEQKTMLNSYQQVVNLLNSFDILGEILEDSVLLVDDMCDSGWTLTILGEMLRQKGASEVYPFALAKVGAVGA